MRYTALAIICVLLAVATVGCLGQTSDAGQAEDLSTTVKTMDEYRGEASRAITADNAEAELQKLTQEIDGDQ